jgi:hypothetical protein
MKKYLEQALYEIGFMLTRLGEAVKEVVGFRRGKRIKTIFNRQAAKNAKK